VTVHVVAYDTAHPGDTSEFARALAQFEAGRIRRLAILAKTEGNAEVNDYSREYGLAAAEMAIERHGGRALVEKSTFLFSTGCEGAMTPCGWLFADVEEPGARPSPRGTALAIGCARSRAVRPEEIGTPAHADLAADTVRAGMRDAGVAPEDVALVIVKTPVTVPGRRITSGHSKAVGALGAGVALGEVERARIVQDAIDVDHSLYARRAMVFSGSELDCVEIMLLANRRGAPGALSVQTGFLRDLLDAQALRDMFAAAGLRLNERGEVAEPGRIAATLVKAGAAPDGKVRGRRTTMKSSHIDMDKHVRAAVSGILGSILGDTRAFISANTVHQAPPGGGLAACIVRHEG
jgi:cyanuric acid amidohydrolase